MQYNAPKRWNGAAIRKRRLELGLNQTELAMRIGISQPQMSAYERGLPKPEEMKLPTMISLMAALRWSLPQFLAETGITIQGVTADDLRRIGFTGGAEAPSIPEFGPLSAYRPGKPPTGYYPAPPDLPAGETLRRVTLDGGVYVADGLECTLLGAVLTVDPQGTTSPLVARLPRARAWAVLPPNTSGPLILRRLEDGRPLVWEGGETEPLGRVVRVEYAPRAGEGG